MLLFIFLGRKERIMSTLFQYISCYCLSIIWNVDKLKKKLFQYISCYCLSYSLQRAFHRFPYFNTSHVTVYPFTRQTFLSLLLFQYISCYCLSACLPDVNSCVGNFNTSHVTVYQFWFST